MPGDFEIIGPHLFVFYAIGELGKRGGNRLREQIDS
jgi:hypothetical protein